MKMIHPDVEAVADVVSHTVYNAVWAPRGWTLLAEPEAHASEVLGRPVKKLDDLKVDELRGLIAGRGLEYPAAGVKKADVLETFRGTFAEPAGAPAEPEAPALAPRGDSNNTTDTAAPAADKDK